MIALRITEAKWQRIGHPYPELLKVTHVLKQLREAGIPVTGVISLDGVSSGKLTMYTDAFGDRMYEWDGEVDPFAGL